MSWSSGAVFGAVLFPQTSAMFRNFRHCNRFFYEHLALLERERALTIVLIISASLCGVSEIRTRDTLLAYTRFPGVPLQPLEHHSKIAVIAPIAAHKMRQFRISQREVNAFL